MRNYIKKIFKNQRGQALTEFILIAAFVGLVMAVASTDLFDGIKNNYYKGVLPLSSGAQIPAEPGGKDKPPSENGPVAKINGPTTVHIGQTITYHDVSYMVGNDAHISGSSWGTKTISRSFMELGQQLIKLTVVDSKGRESKTELIITVENGKPTPIITMTPDRVLNEGEGFSISGSKSFDDNGDTLDEWEWYMTGPDGKREFRSWPLSGYTFKENALPIGTYTFELRVMDRYQEWSPFISKKVEFNRPPTKPQINAQVIAKTFSYSEINFQAYGSTDPDGDSITYDWSGVSKDNRYSNGTHTVKVRANDGRGGYSEWVEFTFSAESPMKTIFEQWENYIRSGSTGDWKYDSGQDIIYTTQNVNWTGYWNPADKSLKNYKLTWEQGVINQLAGSGWTDDDTIGMTFRMQDKSNFYFVAFDNGGNIPGGIYKMVNGTRTTLTSIPHRWTDNKFDQLEVTVNGNQITVKVNGTTYTATDSTFSSGAYGPFTESQSHGTFKNVRLDVLP